MIGAMLFDGSSGRRPSAEARRYVFRVLVRTIAEDLTNNDGWLLGGVEDATDRRRIKNEAVRLAKSLERKAKA